MIDRLNEKKVREARPGKLCDGGGLWLFTGAKSKSWVFRYTLAGKAVEMGIGSCDTVNLADAREKARLLRHRVRRKDETAGRSMFWRSGAPNTNIGWKMLPSMPKRR